MKRTERSTILFRVGACPETGFGGIKRCTYLASLLKKDFNILFCPADAGDKTARRYLKEHKWPHCRFKELKKINFSSLRAVVLDLERFADEDLQLLKQSANSDTLRVRFMEPGHAPFPEPYPADIVIDGSVPGQGPEFALLNTRFRHFNRIRRKYRKEVKQVLVGLGGMAGAKHLRKVVDALSRQHYRVKVAAGFCLKKNDVKTLRRIYPGTSFVGRTDNLARAFFEADAAVITPGLKAYEAAAVGTPAFYFPANPRQHDIARALEDLGVGTTIAHLDQLIDGRSGAVDRLVESMGLPDLERRIEMGLKGKQLVDGLGLYRVLELFRRVGLIEK